MRKGLPIFVRCPRKGGAPIWVKECKRCPGFEKMWQSGYVYCEARYDEIRRNKDPEPKTQQEEVLGDEKSTA